MQKKQIGVANHHYHIDVPDLCPVCYRHSEVAIQKTSQAATPEGPGVQVVFQCGYGGCQSFFVGYYGAVGQSGLLKVKPSFPRAVDIPEPIKELSPQFCSIFLEAEQAHQIGLSQIAGPGFRKAFEFLVKDYAKALAPNESAAIENEFSGTVVNKFITDPRIQTVSKRALWLGNDETHYLRKWEQKDIEDFKILIWLTINWIEIDRLSKHYEASMPEKR